MLFGQDLGGCHDTSLEAVVQGDEHSHQGYEGLTTAHIALQQTVHLPAGAHVLTNLVHHALLGACQREGQVLMIERVEDVADAVEHIATVLAALVAGIP